MIARTCASGHIKNKNIRKGYFPYTMQILGSVNSAAMNIGVHVYFRIMVFFGYIHRSGIVGSYGDSSGLPRWC